MKRAFIILITVFLVLSLITNIIAVEKITAECRKEKSDLNKELLSQEREVKKGLRIISVENTKFNQITKKLERKGYNVSELKQELSNLSLMIKNLNSEYKTFNILSKEIVRNYCKLSEDELNEKSNELDKKSEIIINYAENIEVLASKISDQISNLTIKK